jgi:DNA-directed RNA polymerase subunit E'/Rpb7
MQHTAIFEEQVPLTPKDMRDEIESIDDILQKKLQLKLEGRCSHHGFVLPGSVKILSRSMGVLEKGRFTGSILFHVHAEGDVLNPPEGTIIEGEVIRKNKMGMYVSFQDAIRIILPRDLHIGNEAFDAVELQDRVSVEIKKSRFQVNDPYILSVGVFRSRVGNRPRRNVAAPALPVEQEEQEQEGPSGLETLEEAVDEMPEGEDDDNLGNAQGTGTGAELEVGVEEGEEVEATA